MDRDFCNKVVTIPQSGGTCWFTAILMSLLYSQNSRKILYNHFEQFKHTDELASLLDKILKSHYVDPKKAEEFFLRYSSEHILDIIRYMDGIRINQLLLNKMKTYGAYPYIFLPKFIRRLNKTCLTLDYYGHTFYTGINEYIDHGIVGDQLTLINNLEGGVINTPVFLSLVKDAVMSNPDYICVNIWNHNTANTPKPYYATFLDRGINTPEISDGIKLHNYGVEVKGLYEFKDEITYNGETYVLNSCILGNYNEVDTNHAIAGIVCKNGKYVYNGWTYKTVDPAMMALGIAKNELPCFLVPYKWDVNNHYERFCLNPAACSVERIHQTRRDLCFSFGRGLRVVLYVKKTNIKSIDENDYSPKSKKKSHTILTEMKPSKHLHDIYKTLSVEKSDRSSPSPIQSILDSRISKSNYVQDKYKTNSNSSLSRLRSISANYKTQSSDILKDLSPVSRSSSNKMSISSKHSSPKKPSTIPSTSPKKPSVSSSYSRGSKYFSSVSVKTDKSLYVSSPNKRPKLLINRNKEEIEDRINELLESNKGLLLTNKKIVAQIKKLKLKIKLL
jgi:hypothetical protein